jgi:hypothetical protein
MEEFKLRMFKEQDYLVDKIEKLERFILTKEFRKLNFKLRWYTKLQLHHMYLYSKYLNKRTDYMCTMDDVEEYANLLLKEGEETLKKEKEAKETKRKPVKKTKKNA